MSKCKVIICDDERTHEGYCEEHYDQLQKVRKHNREVEEEEKQKQKNEGRKVYRW